MYFGIFHSNSVIMLVLCPVLIKNNVHQFLLSVSKMNDTVDFEDNLCAILVVIKLEFSIQSL